MMAPDLSEAFGPVLPAYEGQTAHETALEGTNCRDWKSGTAKLKITDAINDHLAETLLGDFPDHSGFLIFLSYVVSHEPRKRRHKKHDIKQNEYPPIRQYCIQFAS